MQSHINVQWHEQFRNGRTTIGDDERRGRSSSLWQTFETNKIVQERLDADIDDFKTLRANSEDLYMFTCRVHKIVTEHAHVSKLSLLKKDNQAQSF